jgi:uroporphyrinogen decarboxylase
MTTHRSRIEACLAENKLDRIPVALWRHFPVDDQTPEGLASATLAFQRTFDFDLIKVSPASSFCIKDWGAQDEWQGATEGTREYTRRVINHPDDWSSLEALDPGIGFLGDQLTCLRLIYKEIGPETPMIQTIFNPLSQAKNLVGKEKLLVHMRRYPDALHEGLEIIKDTTIRFIENAIQTGIAGIFYAVQHAQYGVFSEEEYQNFGMQYDLQILEPAKEMWLNMLHLHGNDIMFDQFVDFPVNIINWHDQETYPSLSEALLEFPGVVCGGLGRHNTMVLGTPENVRNEALKASEATGGQRFILGTGCVVPTNAPYGNIMAARQSLEM